jgi:hypothetical protein
VERARRSGWRSPGVRSPGTGSATEETSQSGIPQDQRTQFLTNDGTLILMRYDAALIRGDEEFSRALASGRETTFADRYMCMTPQLDVSNDTCTWLTQNLFIGRGRLAGPRQIEYELYRVI